MNMERERMMDKTHKPNDEEMVDFIGGQAKEAWLEIRNFIKDHYDFEPETVFGGAKYGWEIRYRKSGRTLCSLTPEKGAFTVLIVLGSEEAERALSARGELSLKTNRIIEGSRQFHDGRWLWIRLMEPSDTQDIKKLLQIKRKPKR